MSALEQEYGDRIDFEIREAHSPEGQAAVGKYGWKDAGHGLVTFDADGARVGVLAGHNYGPDKVRAQVEALLPAPPK